MDENSNVVRLRLPDDVDDPLTEVLRAGARRLLAQAVDLEVDAFLAERADLKLPDGRTRLVRHGHGPEREVQTGIGAVAVARPKVRDRGGAEGSERIRFTSAILPRWSRRTRSLDALLPTLYLRGISSGEASQGSQDAKHRGVAMRRGLSRGLVGAAREGRPAPVTLGRRPPHGRVAGRVRALAGAGPVGPALRLRLGEAGQGTPPA